MPRSYASTVVNAPADEVWERIRTFDSLGDWHSGLVATMELEGGKDGDQVGAIRSFTLHDRLPATRLAQAAGHKLAWVHARDAFTAMTKAVPGWNDLVWQREVRPLALRFAGSRG